MINYCRNIPFIYIKYNTLYVYNHYFFKLLRFIHLEDRSYYSTINTPFFVCNYNLIQIENHSYYKENDVRTFPY